MNAPTGSPPRGTWRESHRTSDGHADVRALRASGGLHEGALRRAPAKPRSPCFRRPGASGTRRGVSAALKLISQDAGATFPDAHMPGTALPSKASPAVAPTAEQQLQEIEAGGRSGDAGGAPPQAFPTLSLWFAILVGVGGLCLRPVPVPGARAPKRRRPKTKPDLHPPARARPDAADLPPKRADRSTAGRPHGQGGARTLGAGQDGAGREDPDRQAGKESLDRQGRHVDAGDQPGMQRVPGLEAPGPDASVQRVVARRDILVAAAAPRTGRRGCFRCRFTRTSLPASGWSSPSCRWNVEGLQAPQLGLELVQVLAHAAIRLAQLLYLAHRGDDRGVVLVEPCPNLRERILGDDFRQRYISHLPSVREVFGAAGPPASPPPRSCRSGPPRAGWCPRRWAGGWAGGP